MAIFFQDEQQSIAPPFTVKSTWIPPPHKLPPQLNTWIKKDLDEFKKTFLPLRQSSNLTSQEAEALKQLKDNKQIVIKPADKGSAIVIMDREQYLWEGYRQLNDTKYYKKLKKPIYLDTVPQVKKIISSLYTKRFINAKQKSYLIGQGEPRPRIFYMLPKIHKDSKKWSRPHKIPPGRPIVSDCSSETYFTAEYLDHYLNPLSTGHPSYLKDTYDFISKIKSLEIPPQAILFTMDVDSLYTNIEIAEGIQAIQNRFTKSPDNKRPDKELIQLLEINLTRNDFVFNGEYFLQIKGTAMGKKFAPAYANIFMAEWEASALSRCTKQPLHYLRYLDDIWGVWTHSQNDFEDFLKTLNNHNPSIQLKSTTSHTSVDFLDTSTYKGPNFSQTHKLDIKVYFKDTDTHALLHKHSFHPRHTHSGIIKSQLLRFHRICTQKQDFLEASKTLFRALRPRGYNRSFLRKCYKTYLTRKDRSVDTSIPFVSTYSSATLKWMKKVKTNFQNMRAQSQILPDHSVIAAFRKNKSLRDYLVKAKLAPMHLPPTKHLATYLHQTKFVQNKSTKQVFPTHPSGSGNTKNCVYLITCHKCGSQYVGETGNTILMRMAQHKYNITKQKETHTYLVQHFLEHGWESFRVLVLQASPLWTVPQRKRAEKIWMLNLSTRHPNGLNER